MLVFYNRVIKVSRTIADLSGKPNIDIDDITEAISYRTLDRQEGVLGPVG